MTRAERHEGKEWRVKHLVYLNNKAKELEKLLNNDY